MNARIHALLPGLTLVTLVLALSFHFLMTAFYLLPMNPLKLRFHAYADYMQPFFRQTWTLFAPDPVSDTRLLLVACRVQLDDGTFAEMPYVDVTTPFRQAHYANRFGPADRVERLQSGAMRVIFQRDALIDRLEEHRSNTLSDLNELLDYVHERDAAVRQRGVATLNRVASAHCDQIYGSGRTVATQMRMVILEFPRFSQRHLPDDAGTLRHFDFPWAPYESVDPLVRLSVQR